MGQEKPKHEEPTTLDYARGLILLAALAVGAWATWQFWQAAQLFHEMGKILGAK